MPNASYADVIVHWGNMDTRIQARPELSHLEPLRLQLESERIGLVNATTRQAALKAETQNTSREIEEHLRRGMDRATRLRDAIRAYYGRTSENLTEFGMNPRRSRKPAPEPPPVEDKKPSEPGPNPVQTAASETDGTIQK